MSKRPEKIALRVVKGSLIPADSLAAAKLRNRDYAIGDVVFAEIKKPRNPKFHRLAHALGQILVENIEAFAELDGHRVLKRLQVESGIGCDEMAIYVPGVGQCLHRTPQSLSFESMDEARFREVFSALCRHVAKTYWPDMSEDDIAHMAEMMPTEEAA